VQQLFHPRHEGCAVAVDFDDLGAPVTATANHNPPARQIKLVRKESEQAFVCLAFDSRSVKPHLELSAMKSRELGPPGIGLHMQIKGQQATIGMILIPGIGHGQPNNHSMRVIACSSALTGHISSI